MISSDIWSGLREFFAPVALAIITALLSFIGTRYWWMRDANAAAAKAKTDASAALQAEVDSLKLQLGVLGQIVTPISTAFQAIIVKQLTHDDTPELDKLLDGIGPPYVIDQAQFDRLMVLLHERGLDPTVDDSERDAAKMLPMIMRRVKAQLTKTQHVTPELKVVAVLSHDAKGEHDTLKIVTIPVTAAK